MRLLTWDSTNEISLTKYFNDDDVIPPYSILSHTWGEDSQEITFADVQRRPGRAKQGYRKIEFCRDQTRRDGYQHYWVDTCCINKDSQSELSEAITSMFRWYQNAAKCYVYLSDVSAHEHDGNSDTRPAWQPSFRTSRWFTRGWTLQELLAPSIVEFFSRDGKLMGTKETLIDQIHDITTIPRSAIWNTPPSQFSVAERIRWTQNRHTKRREDKAYCLLGIFGVFMTLNYGEGENALQRLQRKINSQHGADVASALTQSHRARSLGLCLSSAPLIPPDYFVGRSAEIDTISDVLRPDRPSAEQRRVVLGGMGGVGKTQLALAYTRRYQSSYTSVIWLNATSESTLYLSLQSVTKGLVPAEETDKFDNKQTLSRFHEWLSSPENTCWLLIFDNYDEPDDFDIDYFCPNIGQGAIIITTRLPDRVTGSQVRVQPLQDMKNSLAVLQARSGRKDIDTDAGARRLVERLGGLPLALVTAGTYLCKNTITFEKYLDAYEQRWQVDRRRLLHLPEYRDRTLYNTWNLSYNRLQQDDPAAAQMLQLLAYFNHQDIWYELLSAGRAEILSPVLQQLLTDQVDFENSMTTLVDYCFLEVQSSTSSYVMHSCVHDWVLAGLNETLDPALYWYSFESVVASLNYDNWDYFSHQRYSRLVPHAVHLVRNRFTKDASFQLQVRPVDNLILVAQLLKDQVELPAAEKMYARGLVESERVFGPDHTFTLTVAANLGALYQDQGNFEAAEQAYLQVLDKASRAFGSDHATTLNSISSLAGVYQDQGKLEMAEQMYSQALTAMERVHGPTDVWTLETVNGFGLLYQEQGNFEAAEQMYVRALAGRRQALGPDHTSTLATIHNLGYLYFAQGKVDMAEQMYIQALTGTTKVLGCDHNTALITVHNLGILYFTQGRLDEAKRMYLRALNGRQKALGSGHAMTLHVVNSLGNLYCAQGRFEEAEILYSQALAGRLKTLEPNHVKTLDSQHCLAILCHQRNQLDEAEAKYRQLLLGYVTAVDVDHPSAMGLIYNIGLLYEQQNKPEAAKRMYQKALAGYQKRLGSEHFKTCDAMNNLNRLDNQLNQRPQEGLPKFHYPW